jgi:hypothetical protein
VQIEANFRSKPQVLLQLALVFLKLQQHAVAARSIYSMDGVLHLAYRLS